jgi:hypothetical protein
MDAWIGSAVVAVVISSLVTVVGWFMSIRHERVRENERRVERIEDIQAALLADIRSTSHRFVQIDLDRHLEQVVALISRVPPGQSFTPFVPREPGSLLWPSIAQEVQILPNAVIDPVVLFFSQLESVRYFVDDLRSEEFAALEPERKINMFQDYVRMMKYLVLLAGDAEAALAHSLGLPLVSSSASGLSFRSTASEPASDSRSGLASRSPNDLNIGPSGREDK